MLRRIYRAIILAQAASAANRTLVTMSDRILDDIGQSRDSFAKNVVESVRKELDREDREAAAKKTGKQLPQEIWYKTSNSKCKSKLSWGSLISPISTHSA